MSAAEAERERVARLLLASYAGGVWDSVPESFLAMADAILAYIRERDGLETVPYDEWMRRVDAAVARERERCAQIADVEVNQYPTNWDWQIYARGIASRIRRAPDPPGTPPMRALEDDRERIVAMLIRVWHESLSNDDAVWGEMADAILADRREGDVLAVEAMEARIEAAEARADAAERLAVRKGDDA